VAGQGAGVAAAVSLQEDKCTAQVDIAGFQAEPERQCVRLHRGDYVHKKRPDKPAFFYAWKQSANRFAPQTSRKVLANQTGHFEHGDLAFAEDFLELGIRIDIALVGGVLQLVLLNINPQLLDHFSAG